MTTICFSIPVHEEPAVVRNQIENIKYFLPESFVVLHVSLSSYPLRDSIWEAISDLDGVYLNPISYPTRWGWFLHAHLFNYEYVKSLGLPFDYFLVDSSNSMLVRPGAARHIQQFDFLSDCEHVRIESPESYKLHWGFTHAIRDDVCFMKMMDALGCSDYYASGHEGCAFKRELFDEMYSIFSRYYHFHLTEPRYPKEEIYLPSVARSLTANYSNPITWRSMFHRDHFNSGTISDVVDGIVKYGSYNYWDPLKEDPGYGKHYFGIKGVNRRLDDPLRKKINSLTSGTAVLPKVDPRAASAEIPQKL